jgi:sec-independent protein translocase protein TatB
MFLNIGFGELLAIVLVCLVVFGPERLPEVARQLGRFIGKARLTTQRMLDELRSESELKDLNLPDLKVGNLRAQARSYVTELLDVEGQMAELEREAMGRDKQDRAGSIEPSQSRPTGEPAANGHGQSTHPADSGQPPSGQPQTGQPRAAAAQDPAGEAATADVRPPVDPDAT